MKIAPILSFGSFDSPELTIDGSFPSTTKTTKRRVMNFPWFPLILNFVLLGAFVFVCNTLNTGRRTPAFNGALIFIGFCCLAMLLDFTLTFAFASATTTDRERYIDLSSLSACGERAVAYAIPCVVAAVMALRFRARNRSTVEPSVTIHASEYTQSELRY